MKKAIKLFLVLVFAFMVLPVVHAVGLPTEGVTYFMQYPNGLKEVTTKYNEANNPAEKRIYVGETDSEGNIPLCGWENNAQLRVVEQVPSGYTTNQRELNVKITETGKATFTNYRGDNPKTGRTLLFLVVIGSVIAITIASHKSKKSLLVIPVATLALLAYNVKAAGTCFCIQVVDGKGNPIPNVTVEVYAKPSTVYGAPAVKLDANGGYFMDGTTELYVPLPEDPFNSDDFFDYLEDEDADLLDVIYGVYRNGYIPTGFLNEPEVLHNGDVLKIGWSDEEAAKVMTIKGNGGTISINGQTLTEIKGYANPDWANFISTKFNNGNARFIGLDDNPACSHYDQYGIMASNPGDEMPSTIYLCWNAQPDGIYINDHLYRGKPATCFDESYLGGSTDGIVLENEDSDVYIGDISSPDVYFSTVYVYEGSYFGPVAETVGSHKDPLEGSKFGKMLPDRIDGDGYNEENPRKVVIVHNGQVILTIEGNDFEQDGNEFYIANDAKREKLLEYFELIIDEGCLDA